MTGLQQQSSLRAACIMHPAEHAMHDLRQGRLHSTTLLTSASRLTFVSNKVQTSDMVVMSVIQHCPVHTPETQDWCDALKLGHKPTNRSRS